MGGLVLGCAAAPPPISTIVSREATANGQTSPFEVSLPPGYPGMTAYPLGFGFHGSDRTHSDCRQVDCEGLQTQFEKTTVMVYPKSLGPGWVDDDATTQQNLALFASVLTAVQTDYAVDSSRTWVAEASSGAYFANLLGCVYGSALRAVFPVAGGMVFSPDQSVQGSAAWLLVHGIDDTHVPLAEGEATRDWAAGRNGCQPTTVPSLTALREERNRVVEPLGGAKFEGNATVVPPAQLMLPCGCVPTTCAPASRTQRRAGNLPREALSFADRC